MRNRLEDKFQPRAGGEKVITIIHDGCCHILSGETLCPSCFNIQIQLRLAAILADVFLSMGKIRIGSSVNEQDKDTKANSPNTIGIESMDQWVPEALMLACPAHPAADQCTLSSPFYIPSSE